MFFLFEVHRPSQWKNIFDELTDNVQLHLITKTMVILDRIFNLSFCFFYDSHNRNDIKESSIVWKIDTWDPSIQSSH